MNRFKAVLLLLLLLGGVALWGLLRASGGVLFKRQDQTWQTMQARGVWRVGLDPSFPPFELLDGNGQPTGFDVDLARQIAEGWDLQVEFVAIGFDSLLDAVQTGQVDSVISALPYDPRLTQDVAYSTPYFDAGIRLVILQPSPITKVEDLANRIVAVEWGSMGDMVGRRLQRQGIALKLQPFETPDEAVTALLTRQDVAALLVDNVTLRMAQEQGRPLMAVGPVLESNPYVIALPLLAHELKTHLDERLLTLQERGAFPQLEAKWFVGVK